MKWTLRPIGTFADTHVSDVGNAHTTRSRAARTTTAAAPSSLASSDVTECLLLFGAFCNGAVSLLASSVKACMIALITLAAIVIVLHTTYSFRVSIGNIAHARFVGEGAYNRIVSNGTHWKTHRRVVFARDTALR